MRMRSAITAACSLAIAASLSCGVARAGDPPLTARADSPRAAAIRTQASKGDAKQASAKAAAKVDPADSRTCLTSTGSLIKPKPGHCVNAFGNVYTQDDLWRTGRITPSGALRTLDPAITLVH
jgi:hypothetical protein